MSDSEALGAQRRAQSAGGCDLSPTHTAAEVAVPTRASVRAQSQPVASPGV